MRILIAPERLDVLADRHDDTAQELGSVAAIVSARVAGASLAGLGGYGIASRDLDRRVAAIAGDIRAAACDTSDGAAALRERAGRARWLEAGGDLRTWDGMHRAGHLDIGAVGAAGVVGVAARSAKDFYEILAAGFETWSSRVWLNRLGNMTPGQLAERSARWTRGGHYSNAIGNGLGLLAVGAGLLGEAVGGRAGAAIEFGGLAAEAAHLRYVLDVVRAGGQASPFLAGAGVVFGSVAIVGDVADILHEGLSPRNGAQLGADILSTAGSVAMLIPGGQVAGVALLGASLAVRGGLWIADHHEEVVEIAKDAWRAVSSAWRQPLSLVGGLL